jgi:hypothetical protein
LVNLLCFLSGQVGYFPSTFIATLEYCEDSVIENLESSPYNHLMLIAIDLPQPTKQESTPRTKESSTPLVSVHVNGQSPQDEKLRKGWLSLKDDQSGRFFYFKDGEYVWGS